jgi:hypothetical protein
LTGWPPTVYEGIADTAVIVFEEHDVPEP